MINTNIKGHDLSFDTTASLFSPQQIDKGTHAMLEKINFSPDDKILDLGCGYGVVGIVAAKHMASVFMCDKDKVAVEYAAKNAAKNGITGVSITQSNAYENIHEAGFTIIASNPPYHADFSVPKLFIEKGFNRLAIGGKFYMVTKRKGWYKNKFIAVFGGVRIHEVDEYFVFEAEKRSNSYANSYANSRANSKRKPLKD